MLCSDEVFNTGTFATCSKTSAHQ